MSSNVMFEACHLGALPALSLGWNKGGIRHRSYAWLSARLPMNRGLKRMRWRYSALSRASCQPDSR